MKHIDRLLKLHELQISAMSLRATIYDSTNPEKQSIRRSMTNPMKNQLNADKLAEAYEEVRDASCALFICMKMAEWHTEEANGIEIAEKMARCKKAFKSYKRIIGERNG